MRIDDFTIEEKTLILNALSHYKNDYVRTLIDYYELNKDKNMFLMETTKDYLIKQFDYSEKLISKIFNNEF